jgi:hypothetical protein
MKVTAHIEFIYDAGVVRVFIDDNKYGDEYEWACTVAFFHEGGKMIAELKGVVKPLTPDMLRAVLKTLRREGVDTLRFRRGDTMKLYDLGEYDEKDS